MRTKALWDNIIFHYGLPEKILLHQGRNFKSELIADLCRVMERKKLRTSPYHPQTNGQCERFNSTLIGTLATLPPEYKSDWKGSIGALVHAYNCTKNSVTGFSPYFLMYGRQPQPPIDITLGLTPNLVTISTSTKYIQKIRKCVRWAHGKANLFQQKEVWHHKQRYDKHSKALDLRAGDKVLVHITTFKGLHIKYKIGGKTGNMWWNGSPIQTYQCMWYILWLGKGTARHYIKTTHYPSVTTWSRQKMKTQW